MEWDEKIFASMNNMCGRESDDEDQKARHHPRPMCVIMCNLISSYNKIIKKGVRERVSLMVDFNVVQTVASSFSEQYTV
ncbi:hypothetical protein BLOT_010491 [Blomia tropicalis]|nr:hypothetical protein BLOT_010491 [Blomia tropicalis]